MVRCPACGRRSSQASGCTSHTIPPPTEAASPSAGDATPSLPGFRVERLLGYGGFGAVWGAVREVDGLGVAIKVARLDPPEAAARLEREGEVLAEVGPPSVPQLHASGRLPDGR